MDALPAKEKADFPAPRQRRVGEIGPIPLQVGGVVGTLGGSLRSRFSGWRTVIARCPSDPTRWFGRLARRWRKTRSERPEGRLDDPRDWNNSPDELGPRPPPTRSRHEPSRTSYSDNHRRSSREKLLEAEGSRSKTLGPPFHHAQHTEGRAPLAKSVAGWRRRGETSHRVEPREPLN